MKTERNPNQKAFKIVQKQPAAPKPKEVPAPAIDTASAVSFAMSIAQEMKRRQQEIDATKAADVTGSTDTSSRQYGSRDLEEFKRKLVASREGILENLGTLRENAGIDDADDVEPDGGDGTSQSMRLDAISHIEKSNKDLTDIEEALRRIEDGSYGVCVDCGKLIAKERLLHSPFVKTCTTCQQALEKNRR